MTTRPWRLVVGVAGSSAPQLAVTLLRLLRAVGGVEVHLVMLRGAERSVALKLGVGRTPNPEPEPGAGLIIAACEGALVFARAERSMVPFDQVAEQLDAHMAALIG